jgi:hypothetical protein
MAMKKPYLPAGSGLSSMATSELNSIVVFSLKPFVPFSLLYVSNQLLFVGFNFFKPACDFLYIAHSNPSKFILTTLYVNFSPGWQWPLLLPGSSQ